MHWNLLDRQADSGRAAASCAAIVKSWMSFVGDGRMVSRLNPPFMMSTAPWPMVPMVSKRGCLNPSWESMSEMATDFPYFGMYYRPGQRLD